MHPPRAWLELAEHLSTWPLWKSRGLIQGAINSAGCSSKHVPQIPTQHLILELPYQLHAQ